jgi:hypothetical protein
MDGNGKDDIAMFDTVYTLGTDNKLKYIDGGKDQLAGGSWWDGLVFGNVDDDPALEMVTFNWDRNYLRVFKFNSTGKVEMKSIATVTVLNNIGTYSSISLCLPSIKSPAAVLEFTKHEVQFSEPKVIALLAAPPYYASLGGSSDPVAIQPALSSASTTFGKSTGSGNSSDSKNGFSFSVSAGFHCEAPLWGSAASSDFKATVGGSFDWTSSKSTEETYSYSFNNYTDDDLVVYTVVPIDCYYYTVLNAPAGAAVNSTFLITLPREPVTTCMGRTSYNDKNGDYFDVDSTYMSHTVGQPLTYPRKSAMQAIKAAKPNGLYDTAGYMVGLDNNTQTKGIDQLVTEASTFGYEVSVGVEFEVVAGGALVGGSLAYAHGGSYTNSTTSGTQVSGTVASLSPGLAKGSDQYTWGLMAYPVRDEANEQVYTVVSYWVEP